MEKQELNLMIEDLNQAIKENQSKEVIDFLKNEIGDIKLNIKLNNNI